MGSCKMDNFEEEVASALSGHNVSMKIEEDFESKVEAGEISHDMGVLKKIFIAMDDYIGRARPVISPLQTLDLDPVFAKCLTCLTHIVMSNSEAQVYVQEETCVLELLTKALNDKYNVEHQKVILKAIEILSRKLKILWPVPYLSNLIRNLFQKLVAKPMFTEIFNYCLRIVTNLVFRSSCCLNIVAKDTNYREVIKIFVAMLTVANTDPEQRILVNHLVCLLKPSVDVKITVIAKHFKLAFTDTIHKLSIKKGQQSLPENGYLHSIASTFFYLNQCLDTIYSRLAKEHEDEFLLWETANSQNYGPSAGRDLVNELAKDISRRIVSDLNESRAFITTEKLQLIAESLLGMLKATFPSGIPLSVYKAEVIESLIKGIDWLAKITTPQSESQLVVLETYNHFFGRILTAKSRTVSDEAFHNAFKVCEIIPTSSSKDLIRNVATIRLVMHFTNMVAFNDLVKKHLDEDQLLKLVECLLVNKPETINPPSLLNSMCLVETLNVLSTISKRPTILMDIIQKEETLIHIANCIVNGDEALISKGLSLTGAVGFTQKCRSDLSKILVAMRESSSKHGSTVSSNEYLTNMSEKARVGLKKLNTNLEMFTKNYDGNDCAVDDIISWHKIKSDMHEVEIASMRDQIFQLGRTIAQFKVLINKQSDLITKRAATTAIAEKEHQNLKHMVESMNAKKTELEIKHAKTTDALRKQLSFQEGLFKTKSERLEKLETQITDLKEDVKKLETSKEEVTQSARLLTTEKAKLQKQLDEVEGEFKSSKQRISNLEKDLKKSEESRKATENLLEAERRKTEIIQQVLGNRQ